MDQKATGIGLRGKSVMPGALWVAGSLGCEWKEPQKTELAAGLLREISISMATSV